MKFSTIGDRLNLAIQTAKLSGRLRDWPALGILGLARYRDFGGNDILSRKGKSFFPLIKVRTDRLGHLCVPMNPADISHLEIFNEVVVENVYDLSMVEFKPDLIIDCGAHIGFFTARAASTFPGCKLVIFEPMPKNAALLREMVRLNGITVEIRQEAVSDKQASTKFYERISHGGSLDDHAEGVLDSYDVKVVDLIQLVREYGPARLLLKMDIEGEEENLIPKLLPVLPPTSAIFFETHTASVGWDLIENALRDAGFQTRLLRNRDPYRDGFACRKG